MASNRLIAQTAMSGGILPLCPIPGWQNPLKRQDWNGLVCDNINAWMGAAADLQAAFTLARMG
jgi:hypothetical protein